MSTNPLIGSSWGNQPVQPPQNPLQLNFNPTTGQGSTGGGAWGNPGGYSNPKGPNEINRNMGIENVLSGQMKNILAPQFAQLFGQYGSQSADFFKNLMNLGSPYYQQHQEQAFNQGVNQNQNAEAMARQQLGAQGYGATPSGANAAMLGGMQMQGSQNLAEQYLQNLFANEQMQQQGAQGLAGIASTFNPTQLLGGTSVGANITRNPTFAENFNQITSGIGNMLGGYGNTGLPGSGN
jgi:hypothetical protein